MPYYFPHQPDSPDKVHYLRETYERAKGLIQEMREKDGKFYAENRHDIHRAMGIIAKVEGTTKYNADARETAPDTGVYEDERHAQTRADAPAKRLANWHEWAKQNPNSKATAQDGTVYEADHNGELTIHESS